MEFHGSAEQLGLHAVSHRHGYPIPSEASRGSLHQFCLAAPSAVRTAAGKHWIRPPTLAGTADVAFLGALTAGSDDFQVEFYTILH